MSDKIDLPTFTKLIENIKANADRTSALYKLGINLMDYDDDHHAIVNTLMTTAFGETNTDWISWWMFGFAVANADAHTPTNRRSNNVR